MPSFSQLQATARWISCTLPHNKCLTQPILDSTNSIQAHVFKLTTHDNCLNLTADAFTDSYFPFDLPVSSVEGVLYDTQIKCNILLFIILTYFQLSIKSINSYFFWNRLMKRNIFLSYLSSKQPVSSCTFNTYQNKLIIVTTTWTIRQTHAGWTTKYRNITT